VAGKGIRYDVYTAGQLRNDFECHGQVIQETKSSGGVIEVNLNGTSYEYDAGWYVPRARFSVDSNDPAKTVTIPTQTIPSWYPFNAKNSNPKTGAPRTTGSVKDPTKESAMRDADEGESNGGDVVGAIPGRATNNLPEPWDNHGKKVSNMLHFDGHVVSYPAAYWEAAASRKGGVYIGY
jgi:prepilin-type processing-associated H-X9-DG protein